MSVSERGIDRRTALAAVAGTAALSGIAPLAAAPRRVRRIAVEEGFMLPEVAEAITRFMRARGNEEPGLPEFRAGFPLAGTPVGEQLMDFDRRLRDMDADGIDMQLLLLMSPGVQALDPAEGAALSRLVNDKVAAIVARHPTRFAALATIAPQAPREAAAELERAVKTLGMKGALINSHTRGKYLDDPAALPILEAAQALDVPIYIHPREPAPAMLDAYKPYGLERATWGYAAETALHGLKLIMAGVFDRLPRLRIVLGHGGEGIPFFLSRIDNRYREAAQRGGAPRLKRLPGDYFRENFYVTSSGMNWGPAVRMCIDAVGIDRVMMAVDYPFEDQAATVRAIDALPLSTTERRAFLHGNAERVFRL